MNGPRVTLVHDWLHDFGGAEKVLEALVEAFEPREIHALFSDPGNFGGSPISRCEVRTTFLDRDFFKKRYRNFLPLFPFAVEQLETGNADVVISSSHCVAKGVVTQVDQLHVCYCHTPLRYAWDQTYEYLKLTGLDKGLKGLLAKAFLHYLRIWDESSSRRVDHFISNSDFVGRRIKKFYGRESRTIYPPCDVSPPGENVRKGEDFAFASRLVHYKRADLVIDAFREMKLPLKVIGDGPQYEELKSSAPGWITFTGHLKKEELRKELASSRALVFPPVEDFGILPVEAQALGTPVIALGKGGALETVVPPSGDDFSRATGIFFGEQERSAIGSAVGLFVEKEGRFTSAALSRNAERFSKERFISEMKNFVEEKWNPCR